MYREVKLKPERKNKEMRKAVRKRLEKAAKKGRRIVIAETVGALVMSNAGYVQEPGKEDIMRMSIRSLRMYMVMPDQFC